MGNNKEKAITKMSMRLREENAPAIVEIKLVDDEFSSYMERKIQDDSYRFSVLADFVKRKEQGEILSSGFCFPHYWFVRKEAKSNCDSD